MAQGDATYRSSPVQVGALSTWVSASAGANHCLALKTDGTLWAWGYNFDGELGDGTSTTRSSPVQIGGLTTWTKIAAGNYFSLGLKTDGTLWSWGNNEQGCLGLGDTTLRRSPVQIGAGSNWSKISASTGPSGWRTSLAIKTDKSLWAWGNNQFGQLGQSNLTNSSSPVQITGDWKEVASQHVFVLGIKDAGTLWGWGRGLTGQIGNGTTNSYSSPVQVGSDSTWVFVTGGYNHSHALKT